MKKYYPLKQYTMKCALYPNKTQAKKIDDIIHGLKVYYNNLLYDIINNGLNTVENDDIYNPGEKVHWVDWFGEQTGIGMKEASFYKQYIEKDKRLDLVPKASFSNQSHSIIDNMYQAWETTGKHPIERWGEKYHDEKGNEVTKGIKYYTKAHPRRSFFTQLQCSRIHQVVESESKDGKIEYKKNVFFTYISKVGLVKCRGVNYNIRFDPDCEDDFFEFCKKNPNKQLSCTISHSTDGKYYISFSFGSSSKGKTKATGKPVVWKAVTVPEERKKHIGVDIGEINIAVTSDGIMYDNIFDVYPTLKKDMETLEYYDRKLSKLWGYKNPVFLDAMHKARDNGGDLKPSNQYKKYETKRKKLYQKLMRKRKDYYHKVSAEIVTSTDILGVETLSVTDMFERKRDEKDKNENAKKEKDKSSKT